MHEICPVLTELYKKKTSKIWKRFQIQLHSPVQHSLLPIRLPVDLIIHGNHDDPRYPEADTGTDDCIRFVDMEHTNVRVLFPKLEVFPGGVPASEDRQEAHNSWGAPDNAEHSGQPEIGHDEGIVEWLDDRVVSVHTNTAQMQDGHRAEEDVQGVPDVAHEVSKEPPARELDRGVEGHCEDRDQHVRERQRNDEVVGDDPELSVAHHRHYHQEVT